MPKKTTKKKDWYGLGTRVDKDGTKHLTIMKNAGDRAAYNRYLNSNKTKKKVVKRKK